MNNAQKALTAAKNFVADHRTPITVVVTAATTATVTRKMYGGAYKIAEMFIESKGLTEEFIEFVPTNLEV